MASLLVYFSACLCKSEVFPPSLIVHPPHWPAKECQPWWQPRQQLKGTKRPGKRLSPCRPFLSDTGPPLLTSINPHYCVVGGKGVDGGGLSNLILCDLGGVQREQWVSGSQECFFFWGYLLWTASSKSHKKVAQPAKCNREYFISSTSEPGFKLHRPPRRTHVAVMTRCWCKKYNFTVSTSFSIWLKSVKLVSDIRNTWCKFCSRGWFSLIVKFR